MLDRHPLGATGGARGVDYVRQFIEPGDLAARCGSAPGFDCFRDRRDGEPRRDHGRLEPLAGKDERGSGILQDRPDTLRRIAGIDGHVGGTGPHRRQYGHDRENRSTAEDRHPIPRPDALHDEGGGQCAAFLPESRKGQLPIGTLAHGDAFGRARGLSFEQGDDRFLGQGGVARCVEPGEVGAFVVGQDIHRGDRAVWLGQQSVEQEPEVIDGPPDQPLRQHRVVEVEVQGVRTAAAEVVNLQSQRMHAVTVPRMNPLHFGRNAGEVAEGLGEEVQHHVAHRVARGGGGTGQRVAQDLQGFLEAPGSERA